MTSNWKDINWLMGDILSDVECGTMPPDLPLRHMHPRHYQLINSKVRGWLGLSPDSSLRFALMEQGDDYMVLAVEQEPGVVLKLASRGPKEHIFYKRIEGGVSQHRFNDIPYNFQLIIKQAIYPDEGQEPDFVRNASREFHREHPQLGQFSSKAFPTIG